MKGHPDVITALNELLTHDLTAVDLYLLQSRVCADLGYTKLAAHFDHEKQEEEMHVQVLMDRILLLEGTPNIGDRIGFKLEGDLKAMLELDLEYELEVSKALNKGIALCREHGDNGSRELMERLLKDTENDHIFWLESQLKIIDQIGLDKYLPEQI